MFSSQSRRLLSHYSILTLMDDITTEVSNPQISERLKRCGITLTQQRLDIAAILFAKPQHLSAEQVLELVNDGTATVSKATVYNTLGLFARKGLIMSVIVDPSKIFYDSNTYPHYHFYHADTGKLEDIPASAVTLDHLPELPSGTYQERVDIVIRVNKNSPLA